MNKRIVIKVGSYVLTEKEEIAKERLLELVKLIVDLKRTGYEVILVSSGAISAGFTKLNLDKDDTINRQVLASIGQPYLLKIYQDLFDNFGVLCSQILLPSDIFQSKKHTEHAKNAINRLIENDVIPIINENDTVSIEELISGDNDMLSAHVTHHFDASMLVILSNIDNYSKKELGHISNKELEEAKKLDNGLDTKLLSAKYMMEQDNQMFMASGFDLFDARNFLLHNEHQGGTLFKA